jgi:hypothetical protein
MRSSSGRAQNLRAMSRCEPSAYTSPEPPSSAAGTGCSGIHICVWEGVFFSQRQDTVVF